MLQSWIEQQLTIVFGYQGAYETPENQRAKEMRRRFPRPKGLAFIHCQDAACVLGKKADAGPGYGAGTGRAAGKCASLRKSGRTKARQRSERP